MADKLLTLPDVCGWAVSNLEVEFLSSVFDLNIGKTSSLKALASDLTRVAADDDAKRYSTFGFFGSSGGGLLYLGSLTKGDSLSAVLLVLVMVVFKLTVVELDLSAW